jgi:hypothetical protein
MGSTPFDHSDRNPRKGQESGDAAAKSDAKNGGPAHAGTAAAVEGAGSDTQELSREEVASLISVAADARDAGDDPPESTGRLPADGLRRVTEESPQVSLPGVSTAAQQNPHDSLSGSPSLPQATLWQAVSGCVVGGETDGPIAAGHAPASVEAHVSTRWGDGARIRLRISGLVAFLVLSAAFGFSYLSSWVPAGPLIAQPPAAGRQLKNSPPSARSTAADPFPKAAAGIQPAADGLLERLNTQQDRMDVLRDQLLGKAEEIANLRRYYRESIREVATAVLVESGSAGIHSLQQALETKRIAFQLETIRRRQAYIACLAEPLDWLRQGSEELLYLKRKHFLQALASPVCSQIDPERMAAEKENAIAQYSNSAQALKVDLIQAPYDTLEHIWQNLLAQEKRLTPTGISAAATPQRESGGDPQANNRSIWNEFRQGRFDRKAELTALSTEAADCLAGWKEPDLFLNGIQQLPAEAARRLFKWKGNWCCLNGLTALPAETAEVLFQWSGAWLSLNGVKHLSLAASIFLAGWKGRTLELMGLSPESMALEPVALKHLAQWQRSGGRLFVSERVRQLLDETG